MPQPWEIDWSGTRAAPAAGGATLVPLPEKPKTPTPQTPAQAEKDQLEVIKLKREIAKTPETDPGLQQAIKGLGLDELLTSVIRAREHVGTGWATGIPGSIADMVPGSPRRNFKGVLGGLKGAITMEKLQALKDASKTGASGMGSLTEQEGERLASSVAALADDMSQEEIEKSLDIVERHAKFLQAVGAGKDPNDPAVQKEFGIKPLPGEKKEEVAPPLPTGSQGDIGFNTPPRPSDPLNPAQEAAYDLFWQNNPKATAAELKRFGGSIGVVINNADEIIKARDAGAGIIGGAGAVPGLTPQEQAEVDERVKGAGTFKRTAAGVADTLSLGTSNKIIAAGRDLTGKGEYDRELLKANATTDQIAHESPLPYYGGAVAGGLALPGFGAKSINQLGKLGALYGGAYGAGSSDHLNELPANLMAGTATGYALGAGLPAAGNLLGKLGPRANAEGREVYDAAARLGMVDPKTGAATVMPADVGGTFTRKMTSAGAQGPVSAIPIVKGARRVTESAQAARDRIAASVGNPAEIEAAGQSASKGAEKFIKRTSNRGGDLYKRAEALAGDSKVAMPKAVAALDKHIAELSESPTGSDGLAALTELRGQLAGEYSPKGIRMMRTQLRDKFVKDGLTGSDIERRTKDVLKAAAEDIADGLASQGKANAAGVYKLADRYWAARLGTIDSVLQPIIGRKGEKSGEEVMAAVNRAVVGNNERLGGLLKALPSEEQSTVRATIISQLGKSAKGNQNNDGSAFSLSEFLTHWNGISDPAKRTLFRGQSRAALDDLALVANGSKAAQRHGNFSNTAGGITGQAILTGVPLYAGGLFGAAASAISQYGAGKLLASPGLARWLVGAAKTKNPKAHIRLLDGIAAKDAGVAAEVTGLKQALLNAVNDNPVTPSVAASKPDDGGRDD